MPPAPIMGGQVVMKTKPALPRPGNLGIVALVALNIVFWLVGLPPDDGRPDFSRQVIAEMLSTSGMILMACGIFLSLRPKFLESYFGGLDKMYVSHRTAALIGLGLVVLHFAFIPITGKVPLARDLGRIALVGFLGLIALTLAQGVAAIGGPLRMAYHRWKLTHRLVGAFFILGMVHAFNAPTLLYYAEPASTWWKIFAYGASAAYLYKQLLAPFLAKGRPHQVAAVRRLNPSTVEISLRPDGAPVSHRPGQFAFVRFPGEAGLSEPHPFSISSGVGEETLRFTIKASGDWTKALHAKLGEGAPARVEGGHGRFDYLTGGAHQIWITGGIGVTPFLSWIRSLRAAPAQRIAFFYAVRAETDALFWDEFAAAAAKYPSLTTTLNVSSKDGSLILDKIRAAAGFDPALADVYLCGPPPMTIAFADQFSALGIPRARIHYEEFSFR